jgi:hypothetical protein
MRDDRDAAQECRGDSYGRSLAATLNCLAGDWIDRTAFAACWFDNSLQKTGLLAQAANSAMSLKQAVFGHLREF